MDQIQLIDDLILDEGMELKPYVDTVGKTTLGIGRNLDDNGITEAEARYLLGNDIHAITMELDARYGWWRNLKEPAQRALANMAFNMGLPRLSGFKNMLSALEEHDYERAATECLDSRWAAQVGARSQRIADMYRS